MLVTLPLYLCVLYLLVSLTRASLAAQLVENPPAVRETWVPSLGWEDPLEEGRLPLQYSGLENPMDCVIDGVAKSQT